MHKDIFVEKDWKLFRKKVADWQENYIDKLTREYIDLLSGDGNASDKFWELDKRMKKDKKKGDAQRQVTRDEQELEKEITKEN